MIVLCGVLIIGMFLGLCLGAVLSGDTDPECPYCDDLDREIARQLQNNRQDLNP